MNTAPFPLAIAWFLFAASPLLAGDDAALVKERGALLFEDDFDRHESQPDKEEIGNGWTTNSASRAKGTKQVSLEDGAVHVIKAEVADHAPVMFHQAAFQDGAVQVRFKLEAGDELAVEFLDHELKTSHAGHLCDARVTLKNISLTDSKTGGMDNTIREKRQAGDKSPELLQLLKSKTAGFPLDLKAGEWHTLLVVVEGETMRASIDGKAIGEFKSEGIGHPTKPVLALVVKKSAWVDDVKIWKLK